MKSGDHQASVWTNDLTVTTPGQSSPVISGTTMSGSGTHIYSDGKIVSGNQNNNLVLKYNVITYTLVIESFDIETGLMLVDNIPFLSPDAQVLRFGNVFYNQGLIVMTKNSNNLLNGSFIYLLDSLIVDNHVPILVPSEKNISSF